MHEIKWDDSLSVGVDIIDAQHKVLIEKLGESARALSENQGTSIVAQTLDFLSDYTDMHFSTEEKNMMTFDYPGYQLHLDAHNEFKESLQLIVTDFKEEGATSALSHSINFHMMNWLWNHINHVDKAFGSFMKEKGLVMKEE